jgi:hypothetical protein
MQGKLNGVVLWLVIEMCSHHRPIKHNGRWNAVQFVWPSPGRLLRALSFLFWSPFPCPPACPMKNVATTPMHQSQSLGPFPDTCSGLAFHDGVACVPLMFELQGDLYVARCHITPVRPLHQVLHIAKGCNLEDPTRPLSGVQPGFCSLPQPPPR